MRSGRKETPRTYEALVVDGDQSFSDKIYCDNVKVVGTGTFWELVDAGTLNVEGNAEFFDLATCDDFICTGKVLLKNKLIAQKTFFSGISECYGNINADSISVSGVLIANGNVSVINSNVSGKLEVGRNLNTDVLAISGSVISKTKVTALSVSVNSEGPVSRFVTLNAEVVTSDRAADGDDFVLVCDTMDCHLAKLSFAKVDYLFCEKCYIGQGTHVRRLECHEEPIIDKEAVVEEILRF